MQGRGTNRQVGIHASGMGPVGQGWVSSGQFGSSCVKSGQLGSARAKLGQVGSDVDGCGAADRRPGTICFAAVEARSAVNSAAFQSYVDFEYTYARHVEAQGHVCAWMTREQTSRTACSIPMGIARQCMHACMRHRARGADLLDAHRIDHADPVGAVRRAQRRDRPARRVQLESDNVNEPLCMHRIWDVQSSVWRGDEAQSGSIRR